jgi:hypothetical protein
MNKSLNNNVSAESALTFAQDTATKTNKSERSIQVEVQVATNIPERVQTAINLFWAEIEIKDFSPLECVFDTKFEISFNFRASTLPERR